MNGGFNLDGINLAAPVPKRNKDTVLLEWTGLTFEKTKKGAIWYILVTILCLGTIGYSVWQRDWFVIALTPIIAGVIFWYARAVKPFQASYLITPLGLNADGKNYPFSEIHSFWIVYNDKVKKLYIAFTKKYLPTLTVSIDSVDPILLRSILTKKIPEQEKRGESLLDMLVRVIGL